MILNQELNRGVSNNLQIVYYLDFWNTRFVMLFDDEDIFEKIREAKTSQDIYNLIEEKA